MDIGRIRGRRRVLPNKEGYQHEETLKGGKQGSAPRRDATSRGFLVERLGRKQQVSDTTKQSSFWCVVVKGFEAFSVAVRGVGALEFDYSDVVFFRLIVWWMAGIVCAGEGHGCDVRDKLEARWKAR